MTITEARLNKIGSDVLNYAESLLGVRQEAKFNGFKFWDEDKQPELKGDDENGYIIYISNRAVENEVEANFQISHEVIHLLSPTTYENVSVLEEGLATFFSIKYLEHLGIGKSANLNLEYLRTSTQFAKYYKAYKNVEEINNLFETIKRLREANKERKLSDLTVDNLPVSDQNGKIEPLLRKFNSC